MRSRVPKKLVTSYRPVTESLEPRAMLAGLGPELCCDLGIGCPGLPATAQIVLDSRSTETASMRASVSPTWAVGTDGPNAAGGLCIPCGVGGEAGSDAAAVSCPPAPGVGASLKQIPSCLSDTMQGINALATPMLSPLVILSAVPPALSTGEPLPQNILVSITPCPVDAPFVSPISADAATTHDGATTGAPADAFFAAVEASGDPPPVPVPGSFPGARWKWCPDPQNARGGAWRPMSPVPGRSPPSASWDPAAGGGQGQWDVDDGLGNRQRYDKDGKPITAEDAHDTPDQNPTYYWIPVIGVGGYLTYRAVRMLPSLVPALWPTIPANFAFP